MTPPNVHINISGSLLAWYGAVVASITAFVQLLNHLRDRPIIVLKWQKNMRTVGMGSEYDALKMIIVTATNVGRRPVTITGFGAKLLFGKDKNTDWILTDTRPRLPFEITEGKYGSVFVDQGNDESDPVAYWYAWDSAGKVYRRNVAPWYKRWLSTWQWKRNFRKSHLA